MLMKVRADQVPYSGFTLKHGFLVLGLALSLTGLSGCGMDINGELPDSASRSRGDPRGTSEDPENSSNGPNPASQPAPLPAVGEISNPTPELPISESDDFPGNLEDESPEPAPTATVTASPEPSASPSPDSSPSSEPSVSPSPEPGPDPSSSASPSPSPRASTLPDSDDAEDHESDEGDSEEGDEEDDESDESDSCEDSTDRDHGRPKKTKLHKKGAVTRVFAEPGSLGYIFATTGEDGGSVEQHYRCAPNRSFYREEKLFWSLSSESGCVADADPTSTIASLNCDDESAPRFSHSIRLRSSSPIDKTAIHATRTLRELLSEHRFLAPHEYDLIDDSGLQVGALYRERVRSGGSLVEREHYRLFPGYHAPGTHTPITLSKRAWSETAPNLRQFLRRYIDVKGTFMSTSPFVRD